MNIPPRFLRGGTDIPPHFLRESMNILFSKNVKFRVEAQDFLNFPIFSPKMLLILRHSKGS